MPGEHRDPIRQTKQLGHALELLRGVATAEVGRPTSPTSRESPVSTIDGSGLRGGFTTRIEMSSGLCPGVCRMRSLS
jgi:hypothetical protein